MRGPASTQVCLYIWEYRYLEIFSGKINREISVQYLGAGGGLGNVTQVCCVYVYRGLTSYERLKTRDRAFTKKDKAVIHAGGGI